MYGEKLKSFIFLKLLQMAKVSKLVKAVNYMS